MALFGSFICALLTASLSVPSSAASLKAACISDLYCEIGEFCRWTPRQDSVTQGSCTKCVDCSLVNKKSHKGCVRSERECGGCEVGFVLVNNQCHHAKPEIAALRQVKDTLLSDQEENTNGNNQHTTVAAVIITIAALTVIIVALFAAHEWHVARRESHLNGRSSCESFITESNGSDRSQPQSNTISNFTAHSRNFKKYQASTGPSPGLKILPSAPPLLIARDLPQQAAPFSVGDNLELRDDEANNNPGPAINQPLQNEINEEEFVGLLEQALQPPYQGEDAVVPQQNLLPEESVPLEGGNGDGPMAPSPLNAENHLNNEHLQVRFGLALDVNMSTRRSNSRGNGNQYQVVPHEESPPFVTLAQLLPPNQQDPNVVQWLSETTLSIQQPGNTESGESANVP